MWNNKSDAMRPFRFIQPLQRGGCALVGLAALASGCAVEYIDKILAERGVTECSSSTGDLLETSDSSTGSTTTSGTETSTTDENASSSSDSSDTSETSDSSTTDSNSTGSPGPVCGNGLLEDGETCDDGNEIAGDGCQECAKDSLIFVSSETYKGYAIGGLHGADQRCRSLAAKAGLPRPETFRAWLSTPTMSAGERLVHSRGRYVLVNGLVVASNWDGLTGEPLQTAIMVDENSQTQDYVAWTGTLASGEAAPGSDFCGEWDDNSGKTLFGGTGLTASADSTWSFFEDDLCWSDSHLYCVQQ